jgi:hypothetical protein
VSASANRSPAGTLAGYLTWLLYRRSKPGRKYGDTLNSYETCFKRA